MNDSLEKLAMSCTFAIVDGKITPTVGGERGRKLALARGFVVDSKYKIIEAIGEGGMGAVYKVHHLLLAKDMALKTFSTETFSDQSWQRFQREAQSIGKLRHKNIVEVFDFGIADGELPYYTMELLRGENLAEKLERERTLLQKEALAIFLQVADGLAHAHRLQIVHRDVKPANIFLTSSKSSPGVKVVDFGIAKLASDTTGDEQFLTGAGTIFGSPLYMSPEQSLGQVVDQRSDIYSFGCSLFQALAGRPPFIGSNPFHTLMCHQNEAAPQLKQFITDRPISQRLESMMARLLSKNPDKRYQSFEEVIVDLKLCQDALSAMPEEKSVAAHTASLAYAGGTTGETTISPVRLWQEKNWIVLALVGAVFLLVAGSAGLGAFYLSKPATVDATGKGTVEHTPVQKPEAEQKPETQQPKPGKRNIFGAYPYFRSLATAPNQKEKVFYFPAEKCGADLKLDGEIKTIPCVGKVSVPARLNLQLVCREGVTPEFIQRFRPDDLTSLTLAYRDSSWTAEHMEAASHLTSLKMLSITDTVLDQRWTKAMDKLPNLNELCLSAAPINPELLARMHNLQQLRRLTIIGMDGIMDVIRAIKPPYKLRYINIGSNHLTAADMADLARINTLEEVFTDFNNITPAGVEILSKLPTLYRLSLAKIEFDRKVITPLSHCKKLAFLRISIKDWSDYDRASLVKALPRGCEISVADGKYTPQDEK